MFDFIYNLLLFVISLSILVTIHECGHFFAAKLCKVKVLRFSLGFGKIIFKKTGKDGCEYAISLLPLGGYVKMLGEQQEDVAESDKDKSFSHKSKIQRAFIIFAGPFCNILLAFLLYVGLFLNGVTVMRPIIGDVMPNSVAASANLKPHDLFVEVAGKSVAGWDDVMLEILGNVGEDIPIIVKADFGAGERTSTFLNLSTINLTPNSNPLNDLGLRIFYGEVTNKIAYVKEGSPADVAGILVGDYIVGVDDLKTDNFYRISDYIKDHGFKKLTLFIKRNDVIYQTAVLPAKVETADGKKNIYQVGIASYTDSNFFKDLYVTVDYSFGESVVKALIKTYDMSLLIVRSVGKMITGAISYDNISGPISIAKTAGESAQLGLTFYLGFLALISVNLGILNLLPIPVLDGGQLIFILYEAIFRQKPNEKMQLYLSALGLALLLLLTVFALFNDIRAL